MKTTEKKLVYLYDKKLKNKISQNEILQYNAIVKRLGISENKISSLYNENVFKKNSFRTLFLLLVFIVPLSIYMGIKNLFLNK